MTINTHKLRIDRLRDGAVSMTIGDSSDGAIKEMVNVADQDLYLIKERSIYRMLLADRIDPQRTNSSIPNSNQKIASSGFLSEIVGRSFLTANALFNVSQFDAKFDRKEIMDQALNVMAELLAAEKIKSELLVAEEIAANALQQPTSQGFTIPSVENLLPQVKAFIQRIEHASQALYRFSQIFYNHSQKMFDGFADKVLEIYGNNHEFTEFSRELARFMNFVRNARHCVEHPKVGQKIIVQDFALGADNLLSAPRIEIVHPKTAEVEMAVSDFVERALDSILTASESLMVHLASNHSVGLAGFEVAVGSIPAERRKEGSQTCVGYLIKTGEVWHKLG